MLMTGSRPWRTTSKLRELKPAEKVPTHYLAGAWWTSAHAMNADMMTWEDFKLKFSKYHVPQGLIKKMRDEFRELKQGRMSVVEYRKLSSPEATTTITTATTNTTNNGNKNPNITITGSNTAPVNPKDKSTINCYECGVVGHYSNECPKKLAKIAANTRTASNNVAREGTRTTTTVVSTT
ncbi:hypothetical protein QYE76_048954 [Lolium multiflorum]|uniref:CCHC-type domain-containing protein n=1 Tax=Lolium multiflorum TaxID=4521 RepID=A0AAD8SN77_LOLMU|nr:hypothetical protein QYE76_048954 [Lolium multiflorum]